MYESAHGRQAFYLDRLELSDIHIGWLPG
jgi:hypothetical protein